MECAYIGRSKEARRDTCRCKDPSCQAEKNQDEIKTPDGPMAGSQPHTYPQANKTSCEEQRSTLLKRKKDMGRRG